MSEMNTFTFRKNGFDLEMDARFEAFENSSNFETIEYSHWSGKFLNFYITIMEQRKNYLSPSINIQILSRKIV